VEILNLIPDYYIRQRVRYRVDLMCVLLFAVVMGSIMVAETVSRRELQETRQEYLSVNENFAAAADYINEFFALQVEKKKLFEEAALAASMEDTIPLSYIVGVITNARHGSLSVTNIRGIRRDVIVDQPAVVEKSDAPEPPPAETHEVIRANIQGVASTHQEVNQFVDVLAGNAVMEQVVLKYYRQAKVDEVDCLSFEIDIQCRTDIDVLQLRKASAASQPTSGPATAPGETANPSPGGGS
jgi:hypothetical protein